MTTYRRYRLSCNECDLDETGRQDQLIVTKENHEHDDLTIAPDTQTPSPKPTTTSAGVSPRQAALRSALITGWGQWSNGEKEKAVALLIVQVINVLLMAVLIGIPLFFIVWAFGITDAYANA